VSDYEIRLAKALADASCYAGPTPAGLAGHDVQFYRTDAYLTKAVVKFLAEGVMAGQPIIVVATEAHRRAFADGLRSMGLDPEGSFGDRLAVWLDARETLETFMEGPLPNRELFMATVGRVFERLIDKRNYLVIRGYGEMVDVLWKDGKTDAAILLEQYWNELADRYKYALLCGYAVDNFLHESGVAGFRSICDHHKHALPLEALRQSVA
jgi:hypothetical protein